MKDTSGWAVNLAFKGGLSLRWLRMTFIRRELGEARESQSYGIGRMK